MTVRFLIACGGSGVNLLGQRKVLDVDGELQIDASKENVVKNWQARDPRSFAVDLDQNIGTTALVFQEALRRIRETGTLPEDKEAPEYVQEGIYEKEDIEHTKFMNDHSSTATALEWGLAQTPAVGGATIRHRSNRHALRQVFQRMTAGLGLGQENPLKVWIVASTAGGTGEGVHRFVAAYLAHFLSTQPGGENTPIFLNFIRIGQLTYRSVNPERTALNTFFGIAADAAFTLKVRDDFPQVTANWFYVDVPDVGTGERSVPVRAEIVEMAAKAIMLEELQHDLQGLLVNNRGIPMVLVRTGYWGKDFGERRKYYETLRQLRAKLRGLVEPDYERQYLAEGERRPPRFEGGEELEEWAARVQDGRYVLERVEGGWQFPRYRMREFPRSLEKVGELVGRWKQATERLLNRDWGELKAEFLVERVRQVEREERRETVPLRVSVEMGEGEERFGREEWFERVEGAHEALAWTRHLLGCDLREGVPRRERRGLVEGLLRQAEEISGILHGFNPFMGSQGRARRAAGVFGEFLRTLVQVDLLVGLERDARRLLDRELAGARQVLRTAEEEFEVVRSAVGGGQADVVIAAELSDALDPATRMTWLQLLQNVVKRRDRGLFKEEVLRGATGLTEVGLRAVLNLRPQADVSEIHHELASHMGQMYDPDGRVYEAPWWAAARTVGTLSYNYRILPRVSPTLRGRLEAQAEAQATQYRYAFTPMGTIGLYVLAFSGVSLTQRVEDNTSTPVFLMKPFVPTVRNILTQWVDEPVKHVPSGQVTIVGTGVCGEPLYVRAMREAGLNEEEIGKIGQFYRFYK